MTEGTETCDQRITRLVSEANGLLGQLEVTATDLAALIDGMGDDDADEQRPAAAV